MGSQPSTGSDPSIIREDRDDRGPHRDRHNAPDKRLEFPPVAVMPGDDDVNPVQERIGSVRRADLEEVYNTERHLLYVACTRARDHLLVTGVDPASEFLVDLA
jgi:ATP-dependent exoDNAse (exonuclease V) beta subunit